MNEIRKDGLYIACVCVNTKSEMGNELRTEFIVLLVLLNQENKEDD